MGNPKKDSKHFVPSHIGTQSRSAGGNKGKQMQDTIWSACPSDANEGRIEENKKKCRLSAFLFVS